MQPVLATPLIPEPSRHHVSDLQWLDTLYQNKLLELGWWLEFRFLEDRTDRAKDRRVTVKFFQRDEEIATYLEAQREKASMLARQLREGGDLWPAGLFWGVQPRLTRQGCSRHVAAFVTLCCDLDCKDWPELSEDERPRAIWRSLHSTTPGPSIIVWTGHGFHAYWLLRHPCQDKARAEEVQKGMARCLRGDHVADSARLLRWPNSVNYKGVLQQQSRAVMVVWWQPELRYDFDVLADAYSPCNVVGPGSAPACPDQNRLVWKRFFRCVDHDSALKALWNQSPCGLVVHDRSRHDMALAHALTHHRLAKDAFEVIAAQAPWNASKTLSPAYLDRTWTAAQRPFPLNEAHRRDEEAGSPSDTFSGPATAPGPGLAGAQPLFLNTLPQSAWTGWAQLYREAVSSSTEAADEFHYLALLTVLGAILGRTITIPCGRPLHPNVYAMLVGPTGDRKSTAAQLALDLLYLTAPELLVLNGVGSQEGLMERMAEADNGNPLHSRTLLYVDEMASFLKKGRRESSGSLLEFVTEIFQGPEFKTHATRTKAIHLKQPTLSILAASTPAWLEAALEEEDILGGFTNRFVYVAAPAKPDNPLPALPDKPKLRSLASWIRKAAATPARTLGWATGVEQQWTEFYLAWRRATAGQDERVRALLRRIDLYILKFASISAAMDDCGEVQSSHLSTAIDLGRFLAGCSLSILGDLGEHKDCRLERLIEQKLKAANGTMRRKQLRQILGGRVTGEKLDRMLRAMERNGLISQTDRQTTGSAKLVRLAVQD
jgi:hypothetical protein